MLTTYVLEEEANNTTPLNKTVSTGISGSPLNSDLQKAQLEADEHIKQLIKNKLGLVDEQPDMSDMPINAISQRRQRRNFWRNFMIYFTTGGVFAAHIVGVYLLRFLSYKMISNKDILSFKRR